MDDLEAAERTRQSAHVLLDTVSAFRHDPERSWEAMDLAISRLAELDAVVLSYDPETQVRTVDVSGLSAAAVIVIDMLLEQVVQATRRSDSEVIFILREYLDTPMDAKQRSASADPEDPQSI